MKRYRNPWRTRNNRNRHCTKPSSVIYTDSPFPNMFGQQSSIVSRCRLLLPTSAIHQWIAHTLAWSRQWLYPYAHHTICGSRQWPSMDTALHGIFCGRQCLSIVSIVSLLSNTRTYNVHYSMAYQSINNLSCAIPWSTLLSAWRVAITTLGYLISYTWYPVYKKCNIGGAGGGQGVAVNTMP